MDAQSDRNDLCSLAPCCDSASDTDCERVAQGKLLHRYLKPEHYVATANPCVTEAAWSEGFPCLSVDVASHSDPPELTKQDDSHGVIEVTVEEALEFSYQGAYVDVCDNPIPGNSRHALIIGRPVEKIVGLKVLKRKLRHHLAEKSKLRLAPAQPVPSSVLE